MKTKTFYREHMICLPISCNHLRVIQETVLVLFTWFDLHDYWFAVLIPHLLNVQQLMGIAIMPGPAVHKHPGATAAAVHHQAIVQVGVACICCIHIRHPCQVPFGQR